MIFFLNTVNTNGPFVRKVIISSSVMVVISIQAEYSHTQITDRTATQCCIYLKIDPEPESESLRPIEVRLNVRKS